MSGAINKELFDSQFKAFASLLRQHTTTEESTEDAKIKALSLLIFAAIRQHPDLQSDPEVEKLFSERSLAIQRLQALPTEDTADRVVLGQARGVSAGAMEPILPQPSAKLLFNLLADEFGANSFQLEGIGLGEVLNYVTGYIKQQQSLDSTFDEGKQRLLRELEIACRIESVGLSNLPLKELLESKLPFLIPGGWVGLPSGHAVYYEVIPCEDATVNFRIFNTGAGSGAHGKEQIGVKEKVSFLEWEKIPKEKLLHPHFAQILHEMTTHVLLPNTSDRTDYETQDIYENLKAFLQPRSVNHGLHASSMQPQRAGTCACRSLFAFLKSKMPLEEYQRLKLDLRIQALIGFIKKPIETELSLEIQYHLVEKATKKLSQRVQDLYGRVIEDEAAIKACDQLHLAQSWLKAHKIEKGPLFMDESLSIPIHPIKRDNTPPIESLLATPEDVTATQSPLTHIMNQISSYRFNNPETFIEDIKQASAILQTAYENKEYAGLHFAIVDLSKKIPIAQNFWDALKPPNPEIEPAINHLATLSQLFFKSCYRTQEATAIFSEKQYALRKLLFAQVKLTQILDYEVSMKGSYEFLGSFSSHYIQGLDNVIDEEMKYLDFHTGKKPLSIFPLIGQSSASAPPPGTRYIFSPNRFDSSTFNLRYQPSQEISRSSPGLEIVHFHLSEFLKDKYPEVLEKIIESIPEFQTKKPEERECLILLSPLLPSWIQSIEKSSLCLSHIKKVIALPLENSSISLDFKYENRGEIIDISLEGLTPDYFKQLPLGDPSDQTAWSANQIAIKKPMIKELIDLARSSFDEKCLYSTGAHVDYDYKILRFKEKYAKASSREYILELMHIFTSRRHSLIEALAFFTRHPEKLSDIDYEQLFQMACFNCISSEEISNFRDLISRFLSQQITFNLLQGDSKTAVFLQRMGRYFKKYGCGVPDITPELLKLLEEEKTTPEEKSLIYAELAASLNEYPTLTDSQGKFLLKAKAWLEYAPIPPFLKDPKTAYDVQKTLCKHSQALIRILLPEGLPSYQLLNEIYTLINEKKPPEDLRWECIDSQGMSPRFTSNHIDFYDPMRGRFFTIGQKVYLPLEIRENFEFQKLFPDQLQGIARSLDTYEFFDKDTRVLVRKMKEGIAIEQYKDGEWFRYIPGDQLGLNVRQKFQYALESRYLADKYHVWHSIREPIISTKPREVEVVTAAEPPNDPPAPTTSAAFPYSDTLDDDDISAVSCLDMFTPCVDLDRIFGPIAGAPPAKPQVISTDSQIFALYDNKTGIKTYEATYLDGFITSVTRISDKAILGISSQLLTNIEDPSYIQEWYNTSGKRIEIELPRFKLSFKADCLGALQCQEHPGFFLSTDQNLESIGPCKYALILENAVGEKRALLPHQRLEGLPLGKECLQPLFIRHQLLEKGSSTEFTYFTYDLTSNGYLECASKEGYLILAKTLAIHHEYGKAAYYLRKYGKKLSGYSPREIEALKEIADVQNITGDTSGEQVAIALFANYLLATNKIRSSEALEELPDLYKQYLLRLRNVTALKLLPAEELHLVKSLIPEPLSHEFTVRVRELDSSPAQAMGRLEYTDFAAPTKRILLNDVENLITEFMPPHLPLDFEKTVLITRPGKFIKDHLIYIIQMASSDSKLKEWLKTACIFLKTTDPSLALILEQILKDPYSFQSPPVSYGHSSREQTKNTALPGWWKGVISRAIATLEREQAPTLSFPPRLMLEPAHPIERIQRAPPHLAFIFTPNITSYLSEEEAISTWTGKGTEAASANPQLTEFLASQKSEDPVELAEWARLVDDAKALATKPDKTLYTFNKDIAEITPILLSKKAQITEALTSIKQLLLTLAATEPSNPTERALFTLRKKGSLAKEIILDDIFISLALKDPQRLLQQNPHLSQDDLNRLYTHASEYLQIASKGSQVDRCMALCKKIEETPREELKQELGEQLNTIRCYDIQNHPDYLVFEYYFGIIMRQDQVSKLNDFFEGRPSNPVMEMIMGSGKSKVLLPLLGLLRANGTDLSIVVVPSPLFESVASDTQGILQKAFCKSLETLHFDRNSTFTKRSLEEIETFLKTVIEKKQCLIMTSKSIQSLILKFIEYANTLKEENKTESDELKIMINIMNLLQTKGNPLIDEADTILNVLHEVSFSLGKKSPPKEEYIHLIGTLYRLLYSDPSLKGIARLESDPNPDCSAPSLSEQLYHGKLKETLANSLIHKLIEEGILPETIDQGAALNYICRNEEKANLSQEFFEATSSSVQNLLALAAEEICCLLPHTLLKTSNERYGLDKQVIAIPYTAANTPSHGSLFSNQYITMNYTFQIHMKNGIQEDTLTLLIEQLKNQAEAQKRDEQIDIVETTGYKQFCHLKGDLPIPFKHKLHPADLKSLADRINNDPNIRQELIEKLFLPRMELFENKLACNPINLIALFSKVSGFTGTLWNAKSMHSKIDPRQELGTDAKTLNFLIEKTAGPVLIIPKIKWESMFEGLVDHDALIDAGGYFKEGVNLLIARKMAAHYKKSVVFYNSECVQTITDGTTEMPLSASTLKEEERLTFYDQSHTTGADIKQKGNALGFVTISRGMILRDLLQSVWRLRGLEKGQRVQFVIDQEVESIIKTQVELDETSPITFKEILKFVIQNQAKEQGNDNFTAFKQQLDNLSQNLMLEVMTDKKYRPEEKSEAFRILSSTWIKPANLTPAELFGKPAFARHSDEVIDEAAKKCSLQLVYLSEQLPILEERIRDLQKEIKILADNVKKRVHTMLISPLSDIEETVEVDQAAQVEVETEVSTEMETESENQPQKVVLGVNNHNTWEHVENLSERTRYEILRGEYNIKTPLFPIENQMNKQPDLEPYKYLFEGIDISINVLEWQRLKPTEPMRLLGPHKIPFQHLIIEGDKVTIFSQCEKITDQPNYYNLTLGFKDPSRKPSAEALKKLVKIKFLNGESNFTKEEIAVLTEWFTRVGPCRMEEFYIKIILKYQHDNKVSFEQSNLKKLFKRLKS